MHHQKLTNSHFFWRERQVFLTFETYKITTPQLEGQTKYNVLNYTETVNFENGEKKIVNRRKGLLQLYQN